jgi:hypothetical protein
LFAYERAAWTDEHLNAAPAREDFELPDVEGGAARWRWVEGSRWLVEGAGEFDEGGTKAKPEATNGGQGWIYYDNKVCLSSIREKRDLILIKSTVAERTQRTRRLGPLYAPTKMVS